MSRVGKASLKKLNQITLADVVAVRSQAQWTDHDNKKIPSFKPWSNKGFIWQYITIRLTVGI